MRNRLATALAIVVLAAAPRVRADDAPPPPDPPASPEHDAVFRSGLDQFAHGNFIAAIATWESLLATMGEDRGYKVLYNLGLAYQQIGDSTKAIERFRAFERQIAQRQNATPELALRAKDAADRAKQLEGSHGAVHVLAPKRGGIVLTRVGTAEPRTAGYVVWLAPGKHVIEVFVGTDHVKRVEIEIAAGGSVDIDTTPDLKEEPPAPARGRVAPEAPIVERPVPTLVWGLAGGAVVSLALPVALYFVGNEKRDEAERLGSGHSDYTAKRSTYDSFRTAYYVSYALPVGLGIAAGVLYALRPEVARAPATVGLGPNGVLVSGAF